MFRILIKLCSVLIYFLSYLSCCFFFTIIVIIIIIIIIFLFSISIGLKAQSLAHFQSSSSPIKSPFFAGQWPTKKQASDPSCSTGPAPVWPKCMASSSRDQPIPHACCFSFSRHELATSLCRTRFGFPFQPVHSCLASHFPQVQRASARRNSPISGP